MEFCNKNHNPADDVMEYGDLYSDEGSDEQEDSDEELDVKLLGGTVKRRVQEIPNKYKEKARLNHDLNPRGQP